MKKNAYSDGTTPEICIVGAGISGLLAGIQLRRQLGLESFTIYDENSDVGGTWLVNTYPGCACDVQSHLYSYSFEPNPYWSHVYAPREEIWAYLKNVAKKYDLYPKIQFHSQVKSLIWDKDLEKWKVVIYHKEKRTMEERLFDLVINSPGVLRVPNIPKEFQSFRGTMLHTATWNPSVDYENKIVGVIGSGSSAIQIIPALASKVKELHCYQRKPAWVMPIKQFKVPALMKWVFAKFPVILLLFRWFIFLLHEFLHPVFIHGSRLSEFATWRGLSHLKKQIPKNKKLRSDLIPNYRVGCKRIVISNEYFPALQRPNVTLHRQPILQVKENSIVTASREQKLEILILATGYEIQNYFAPMEIIGKNSLNILSNWLEHGPTSYFGVMGSDCPNQFTLLGPNTGLGHNTIIFIIECEMNYVAKLIGEMMKRDAKVIEVKEEAETEFERIVKTGLGKSVWGNENCGSWYGNAKGVITTLWPYTCINFWWKTRIPDYTKFKFS